MKYTNVKEKIQKLSQKLKEKKIESRINNLTHEENKNIQKIKIKLKPYNILAKWLGNKNTLNTFMQTISSLFVKFSKQKQITVILKQI